MVDPAALTRYDEVANVVIVMQEEFTIVSIL